MNDLDSTTPGYEELASPAANQGEGWEPIGIFFPTHGFFGLTGTFDGQGYEIRNLFINRPEPHWGNSGLFGAVEEGIIEDIGVTNATVIGHLQVGALTGSNGGTVRRCYSSGTVSSVYFDESEGSRVGLVGGLVGWNAGTVGSSYSTCNVTGEESVGGLVGWNTGAIHTCYSTGSVTGNRWEVGGLVGDNWGIVSDSYSAGTVIGTDEVGGLVGPNGERGTVNNSFWDTQTSGQATSAGGTGKNTADMKDMDTFSGAGWNITAVNPSQTNPTYTWNIVDGQTYPFLSWQSVS
jgi:hypothetical protein